ncbi:MAG: TonB-dependent receptor [Acidobacteriaceae bacterium]|nr:TonB-dependent receptor [Acidobacteriaceae bacterium]
MSSFKCVLSPTLNGVIALIAVVSLSGFIAQKAQSQGNTGTILGTVTDPSGAAVPKAQVALKNVQTGVVANTTTDNLGNYRFDFLAPGTYTVDAEAPGFRRFSRSEFALDAARELRIDVPLETGTLNQSVTVTAATPLLETESGTLSGTINTKQLEELPISGRDPQQLRYVVPGVVRNRDGDPVAQGGLPRKDPYYIDGQQSSLHVWGGNPVNPNPDVLSEFKVLTNSFSAEFGDTSGVIMTATTKSGTNQFHGSLFEFFQNDVLNASSYYAHTNTAVRYNQFGGTFGGPIIKNRTFFFIDSQITKRRGVQAFTGLTVPNTAFKQGDFSSLLGSQVGTDILGRPAYQYEIFDPNTTRTLTDATGNPVYVRDPFPGNKLPASRLSPAALKAQALYPDPATSQTFSNFNGSGSTQDNNWEFDIKIDHSFTDNDRLSARYSQRYLENIAPAAFPNPNAGGVNSSTGFGPGNFAGPYRQGVVSYIHVFGPRATNNLQLGWFQVFPKRPPVGFGTVSANSLGIFGIPDGNQPFGTPVYNFTDFSRLGSSSDTLFLELQDSKSLVDNASITLGRHTLKFGGEVRLLRTDNFQPGGESGVFNFSNLFTDQRGIPGTGFDYASFLLGLPYNATYSIYPDYFRTRFPLFGVFVQDDFRVNNRLTVNLGLRWDDPFYAHELHNRTGIFDWSQQRYVQAGVNGVRTTPFEQDHGIFGPRFGFAYRLFSKTNTVLRGGYGMFSIGNLGFGAGELVNNYPFFTLSDGGHYNSLDQVHPATTLDYLQPYPISPLGADQTSVLINPNHLARAYQQQWNINIEHQIKSYLFEIGYAGSRGVHLPYYSQIYGFNVNVIPVDQAPVARGRFTAPYIPYPQYPNGVNIVQENGSSSYNSLQIKAEKRFSSGLTFLAAYTFSKLIDIGNSVGGINFGSAFRDPLHNWKLDRGPGTDNFPQRFTIAYTYDLPVGHGRRFASTTPSVVDYIIGGWQLSGILTAQSGSSLTPGLSYDSCVCGSSYVSYPNLISNPLAGYKKSLNEWFNINAFSQPALYTIGNAGKGIFLGPGTFNLDLTLAKRFPIPIRESMSFEFRAEAYNFTNTPQFASPNLTIGTPTAGQITSVTNASRVIQLAGKFYF